MVLGFFTTSSLKSDDSSNLNLYKSVNTELDDKCVLFIERKKLEIESGQVHLFNSFWNPENFNHYSNCNTPTKLYNEISFNLNSGTSLNNERLGVFISQIGNLISTLNTSELSYTNYYEHRQLSGLFHNEELQNKNIQELSHIFLSIRLLCEIYHLSPNEYIKSLAISQILKNHEIIHFIFTYATRLPRISYAISNIDSIYSLVESISAPKDGFFDRAQDDVLGLPQIWMEGSKNFLIKIIADSLTSNSLHNRLFGLKLATIASLNTSTNGNLLYLLKSNLNQMNDQISECIVSNAVIESLSHLIHFIPESVAIHFTTVLYPKNKFMIHDFSQHIRFISYCKSIPKSMINCSRIAYNLSWQCITSLNQNISQVKSSEECLLIIDLLCKYYDSTTKLVYNSALAYQQTVELVTLCLQISQQPFSEITNRIHCSVFTSLMYLHNIGRIDISILYLTLINFGTNKTGSDILSMRSNFFLSSEICCNFLYNQSFKQFINSNISQIAYIILKICVDSLISITVIDTHISYKGAKKNNSTLDKNNKLSEEALLSISSLPKNINIIECIKLGIEVIMVSSTMIACNWQDIRQLLYIISKMYSICLKESLENVEKVLLKDLTESIISLFKQLVSSDNYTCRVFAIFTEMVKKSTLTRFSKKYFETCLLETYDTQSQLLYYMSLRYFEAINLPLPIFKTQPIQYKVFDTSTLNLTIFKSYFLGPYRTAKITRQGASKILSLDFYHSWQNVLKTHITKLYPILLKSENLFIEVDRVHHLFIFGCISSGLYQLVTNYFDQIPNNLITQDSIEWFTILRKLSSNKLSMAFEDLSNYCNRLQNISIDNTWANYQPQPLLYTWLNIIISLIKSCNDFVEILSQTPLDVTKLNSTLPNTIEIIISLKLIDSILSTKSLYSKYAARLYLAKAKLLYHLQVKTLSKDLQNFEHIEHLQNSLKIIKTFAMDKYIFEKNVLEKLYKETLDELNMWNDSNLSLSWAMEFIDIGDEKNDNEKFTFTHPTVYFKAINDLLKTPNSNKESINIIKGINEMTLPIPLVMLFPRPLFYIPFICIIKIKDNSATTLYFEGRVTKDLIKDFNLSKLHFIRICMECNEKKNLFDIRVGNISKFQKIDMIKDVRVIESIEEDVNMYSVPLNIDKLPIGQLCKVFVIKR